MATTPTNLPIPSEDPRDLKFNAGKFDEVMSSDAHYYVDRFGVKRWTIAGFQFTAEEAIRNYGYITMDSFEDGATLTIPNHVLRYEATGEYYRWDGTFPKAVAAGSTPETTGGVGIGAWIGVGDASLRADLSNYTGATLVGATLDGSFTTVQDAISSLDSRLDGVQEKDTGSVTDVNSFLTVGNFSRLVQAEEVQNYINGTTIPRNLSIPYDHFGLTFKNRRGQVVTIFRRGPTHVTSRGVLMKTIINAAGQWSSPVEITEMSDPVLDARVATGGMMPNGKIVICCNYMNPTTGGIGEYDDVKFFQSDDDGESWNLLQTIDVNQSGGYSFNIPFGPAVSIGSGVAISRYKRVGSDYSVGYFYSSDGGNTWSEKDVFTDPTGTFDYNESGLCCIGRLAFMVSRIGSGIGTKFHLFRSTDGGNTWNDLGDSNFTGGDGAYVVAPSLHILRNNNGTPFVVLAYVDRSAQVMYYRTALVSELLSGNYNFSERKRITGGLTNSSGYQSGFFEGHRFIGVVYQEITAQTAAQGISVEFSLVDVPDYDSGWFAVSNNTNYPLPTTGNSQIFQKIEILFSPDVSAGTVYKVDAHSNTSGGTPYGIGASVQASSGNITVKTGSRVFGNTLFGTGSTEFTSGYYRVVAWL